MGGQIISLPFFLLDIQVSSCLETFVSHPRASSRDVGNVKMTMRKAKGCGATPLMQVFVTYEKLVISRDKKCKS